MSRTKNTCKERNEYVRMYARTYRRAWLISAAEFQGTIPQSTIIVRTDSGRTRLRAAFVLPPKHHPGPVLPYVAAAAAVNLGINKLASPHPESTYVNHAKLEPTCTVDATVEPTCIVEPCPVA